MYVDEAQLKGFILDSGLVSKKELEDAESEAHRAKASVGKTLVSRGALTEDDLRRMQAYVLGIPFVNLTGKKIDFETLSLIPEPIARTHNIVAFKRAEDALEVAMLDTDDLEAIDFVKKKVGLKIMPRLTDTESVKSALLQYQKTLKEEFGDVIRKEAQSLAASSGTESAADLKRLAA